MLEKLTGKQEQIISDLLGKLVIHSVRDGALNASMRIAKLETQNPIKKEQYTALEGLSVSQQEAVCDLLSETITDVIYRFLEMIGQNDDFLKLVVKYDGKEYDYAKISEVMGSEIACYEDEGWIQKFSDIGRFVL